jgi:hypothetical protein
MTDHPEMPRDTLAERFKMLMRSPGRTRTVTGPNSLTIESDEGERRMMANVSAACKILDVTNSTERHGDVYQITLLRIA